MPPSGQTIVELRKFSKYLSASQIKQTFVSVRYALLIFSFNFRFFVCFYSMADERAEVNFGLFIGNIHIDTQLYIYIYIYILVQKSNDIVKRLMKSSCYFLYYGVCRRTRQTPSQPVNRPAQEPQHRPAVCTVNSVYDEIDFGKQKNDMYIHPNYSRTPGAYSQPYQDLDVATRMNTPANSRPYQRLNEATMHM